MTLSDSERRQNVAPALKVMAEALGDEGISWVYFGDGRPNSVSIPTAAWIDLVRGALVTAIDSRESLYQLTGYGWIRGLEAAGRTDSARKRLGAFLGHLKSRVKGRVQDGIVDLHKAATELGIPFGWLSNAVEARLVEELCHGRQGPKWYSKPFSGIVIVPRDLGIRPLDVT